MGLPSTPPLFNSFTPLPSSPHLFYIFTPLPPMPLSFTPSFLLSSSLHFLLLLPPLLHSTLFHKSIHSASTPPSSAFALLLSYSPINPSPLIFSSLPLPLHFSCTPPYLLYPSPLIFSSLPLPPTPFLLFSPYLLYPSPLLFFSLLNKT